VIRKITSAGGTINPYQNSTQATPKVREYIFSVARYWIEQGADGWRLDVPNEIDDGRLLGRVPPVVKSANRDAYLVGEIWDGTRAGQTVRISTV